MKHYLAIHPLARGPDAPSSSWYTQITSPSPWVHSWLRVGRCPQEQASSSSAGTLQLICCHPSPLGPGRSLNKLFISKSVKMWSNLPLPNAKYYSQFYLLSRRETSAYTSVDFVERHKRIHHLYNQKKTAPNHAGTHRHMHTAYDRNSSGMLHTWGMSGCISVASLVIHCAVSCPVVTVCPTYCILSFCQWTGQVHWSSDRCQVHCK